jgi:hypothetical protein
MNTGVLANISSRSSIFIQTKNTEEGHSRLEQVEDRISEPEDNIEIKEKKKKRTLIQTTQEL